MSRLARTALLLVLFAGFFATAGYVLLERANAGRDMPEFSVYNRGRNGLAETARFVRRLGYEPVAVTRALPGSSNQPRLLLLVEPPGETALGGRTDLPDNEVKALLRWVAAGNSLVLCTRHTTGIHTALDLAVTRGPRDSDDELNEARISERPEDDDFLGDVDEILVEGRHVLQVPDGIGSVLFWRDDEPVAARLPHGDGEVIVVADPSLLTLRGLWRADNVVFVARLLRELAGDERVYFDEYHHGLQSSGGVGEYLRQTGRLGLVGLALLAAAVAVWSTAVRLGPARSRPTPPRADAVDFASALARLYERAGVRDLLARGAARGFLRALTRLLRLRPAALPAEVLGAWRRQRGAGQADELAGLLRGVAELRKGSAGGRRLLSWVRAFDGFLERAGTSRPA